MSSGYGEFNHKGITVLAHRYSWEIHFGPIPKGKHVLHHCDNPCCINPKHLWIGTNKDNSDDMMAKGRYGYLNYPENWLRGDDHPLTKNPELAARGDQNGMRTCPEAVPRGESHGMSKITETEVKLIRKLWIKMKGVRGSRTVIAKMFGISPVQTGDIIKRKAWRHVK